MMRSARTSISCSLLLLSLSASACLIIGCAKQEVSITDVPIDAVPTDAPKPLAQVNDTALTMEDYAFEIQRRKELRRPFGGAETVVNELVEREVMLQAARNSKWMQDPVVRRELENQMLARWLARTLQQQKDAVVVSDDELRETYTKNVEQYTKPALVRLAILYRKVTDKDPAEKVASIQAELEQARMTFLSNPEEARQGGRMTGFGAIAASSSEEATSRYRGGDLGWLDPSKTDERWPAQLMAAGLALEIDSVSEVLTTPEGCFVVMKTGFRPERVTPFVEVAASLRRKLIRERQEGMEETFLAKLMNNSRIQIDAQQLAQLIEATPVQHAIPDNKPHPISTTDSSVLFSGPRP